MSIHSDYYNNYIKSKDWKQKATARLEIDGYKCQCCGCEGTQTNPLQVHHMNYRSLGHEDIWTDLTTLCKSCHKGIHRMMNRRTAPDKFGWKNDIPISTHVFEVGDQMHFYQGAQQNNSYQG